MTVVKSLVHQFLGNAIDDQELMPEKIALICNMDEKKIARIIEYFKEKHIKSQILVKKSFEKFYMVYVVDVRGVYLHAKSEKCRKENMGYRGIRGTIY